MHSHSGTCYSYRWYNHETATRHQRPPRPHSQQVNRLTCGGCDVCVILAMTPCWFDIRSSRRPSFLSFVWPLDAAPLDYICVVCMWLWLCVQWFEEKQRYLDQLECPSTKLHDAFEGQVRFRKGFTRLSLLLFCCPCLLPPSTPPYTHTQSCSFICVPSFIFLPSFLTSFLLALFRSQNSRVKVFVSLGVII